jgi:predicted acylesterase/phospholipase RssA
MRSLGCLASVWILAVLLAGCTYRNVRLNRADVPIERRQPNRTLATLAAPVAPFSSTRPGIVDRSEPATKPAHDDDGIFFGLSISGGGSRSANFSASCMFELQRLGLLKHVDYVSSVSGGSLTAAYYCVSGDDAWNPGNVQRKLTHSFATDLLINTLLPWNFFVLAISDFDRSDLLTASFEKTLFTRAGRPVTFGDLRADRPRLLINATDLQSGEPFVFCNEQFDRLNSDLSRYPIASAVTASSAVPVLLHQVTLRDFTTVFKQYRHLVDGGVVDNLGVKTLVETYRAQLRANPTAYPRGAVFVVIDARTQYDARISSQGDTGLLKTLEFGAGLTSTVLINRASSATLAEIILDSAPDGDTAVTLRQQRDALINGGYVQLQQANGRPVHVLHLALSRVNDITQLPFKSFSQSINNIATYFNISGTEAYNLHQAAELLVGQRFQKELAQIAAQINGTTTRPAATQP